MSITNTCFFNVAQAKRNKPNNQYVFFKGENALLQKCLANRINEKSLFCRKQCMRLKELNTYDSFSIVQLDPFIASGDSPVFLLLFLELMGNRATAVSPIFWIQVLMMFYRMKQNFLYDSPFHYNEESVFFKSKYRS
ncbi:hypothetical protein A3Q35_14690 [Aeribacillus pallidus]|nr:hypothetical protein A3Q35_14690 [Aeribacillus pallidus]